MRGYAVTSLVHGERPHRRTGRSRTSSIAADHAVGVQDPEVIPISGDDVSLQERWGRIREAWAQATFYLFDPQSWR